MRTMRYVKRWSVQIFLSEQDDETTYAEARLRTHDDTHLVGTGVAKRNPHDINVPEIGDELATARALSELAHKLLHAAAEDIEAITAKPVTLER